MFRSKLYIYHSFGSILFILALIIISTLYGCGGGSGSINVHGDGTSGVRGVAKIVNMTGTSTPAANITVKAGQPECPPQGVGAPCGLSNLASVLTDAQGNFSLSLAPGTYMIFGFMTQSDGTIKGGQVSVTIKAHQFVESDLPLL